MGKRSGHSDGFDPWEPGSWYLSNTLAQMVGSYTPALCYAPQPAYSQSAWQCVSLSTSHPHATPESGKPSLKKRCVLPPLPHYCHAQPDVSKVEGGRWSPRVSRKDIVISNCAYLPHSFVAISVDLKWKQLVTPQIHDCNLYLYKCCGYEQEFYRCWECFKTTALPVTVARTNRPSYPGSRCRSITWSQQLNVTTGKQSSKISLLK